MIWFYNGRGSAEQWIKEGENALQWTRLSHRRFKNNQVRLQSFALAYNLANFLRQLGLHRPARFWTLTTRSTMTTMLIARTAHRRPSFLNLRRGGTRDAGLEPCLLDGRLGSAELASDDGVWRLA